MKKSFALLLALLLAFSVSGCSEAIQQIEIPPLPEVTPTPRPQMETEEPEDPEESTETPQPTEKAQDKEGEEPIRILVANGRTEKTDYDPAEGEELILTFAYDMPRVYVENEPKISERINESLATVEDTFYTGNSYGEEGGYLGYSAMLEAAEDNFSYVRDNNAAGMPLEYSDSLSAKVTRADDSVLSVVYTENCYMGGAHGSYGSEAYNFDVTTGEQLTLDMLAEDEEALSDFLTEKMLDLAEKDEDGRYTDAIAADMLPEGGMEVALRSLLRSGSWYFDTEGLVIFSDLEELGPYAAGIVEFCIPYSELEDEIDAKWLFPGQRQGKGELEAVDLKEIDGGETEIVDLLNIHESGTDLCILFDGRVYDVSVCSVFYSGSFHDDFQFWYASSLCDCALQLKVVVPDGLPNLRIAYTTADGVRHGKLLSQSGLDGKFMLVDDDIEAVG